MEEVIEQNAEMNIKENNVENKSTGEIYNNTDQELIQKLVHSRLEQKSELEYEDLNGYELPPRTQFSMLKKPAVTIKYGKMTFNMAAIRLFDGVEYILPLVHVGKKKLTVVMCNEEENASVAWARVRRKDGQRVNKTITSEDFIEKIYRMMDWQRDCRYKIMGKVSNSQEGLVLVFELEEAIMFAPKPMEFKDEETGEVKKKQIKYYPDKYKDKIGRSYNDYASTRQMTMFEYLDEYVGKSYSDMNTDTETPAAENSESSSISESTGNEQTRFIVDLHDNSSTEINASESKTEINENMNSLVGAGYGNNW